MLKGGYKAALRKEDMKLSDLRTYDLEMYAAIKFKRALPPSSKERDRSMTRLRRAGFIENRGTRSNPEWVILK